MIPCEKLKIAAVVNLVIIISRGNNYLYINILTSGAYAGTDANLCWHSKIMSVY